MFLPGNQRMPLDFSPVAAAAAGAAARPAAGRKGLGPELLAALQVACCAVQRHNSCHAHTPSQRRVLPSTCAHTHTHSDALVAHTPCVVQEHQQQQEQLAPGFVCNLIYVKQTGDLFGLQEWVGGHAFAGLIGVCGCAFLQPRSASAVERRALCNRQSQMRAGSRITCHNAHRQTALRAPPFMAPGCGAAASRQRSCCGSRMQSWRASGRQLDCRAAQLRR
jgi:hypothetical protein